MRTRNENAAFSGRAPGAGADARLRASRLLGACLLLSASAAGMVLASGGPAGATPCGSPVVAGSSCGLTGSLGLTAGPLNLTAPSALSWSGVLNGTDQYFDDPNGSDQAFGITNATANGAGWNVTVSATQFSTGGSSPATLANTGTLSANGSLTSATDTSAPAVTCNNGNTCTLPTNSTSYPVAITTAASSPAAVKVFDAAASTGLGQMTVSNIGWWVAVPASSLAGTYTSTITFEVNSGP